MEKVLVILIVDVPALTTKPEEVNSITELEDIPDSATVEDPSISVRVKEVGLDIALAVTVNPAVSNVPV